MNQDTQLKGFVRRDMFFVVAFFCLALGFAAGVITGTMYSPPKAAMPGGMPPQGMPGGMPPSMPPQGAQQQSQGGLSAAERAKLLELEQAVGKNPKNIEAQNQLGHFYFDHGMPKEAIAAYQASLALKAEQPDIWTDLGVMYREVTEYQKALQAFDKAISQNPRHEIARFNRGIVLVFDLDRKEDGLKNWRELLALNPNAKAPNGAPLGKLIDEVEKQ